MSDIIVVLMDFGLVFSFLQRTIITTQLINSIGMIRKPIFATIAMTSLKKYALSENIPVTTTVNAKISITFEISKKSDALRLAIK